MTMGSRIRNRRKELGLTQEELALKTELSQGYLSQLESDGFNPTAPVIVKLATELKMPLEKLLGMNSEKKAG